MRFHMAEHVLAKNYPDMRIPLKVLKKRSEKQSSAIKGISPELERVKEEAKQVYKVFVREAQKIALARALYKGTPVIVLDEPTAALDPIAEAQVYSDFSNMVDNKTAIYISHRLSSCQFCDKITVFDKGRIVQKGPHAELLSETEGKYCELWNAQAKYYQNA